jgi:hypothetical protein
MRLALLSAGLLLLVCSWLGVMYTLETGSGEIAAPPRFQTPSAELELEAAELAAREGPQAAGQVEALLREAVRRDPSSAYRWAALGEHYLVLDRTGQARRSMQRAAELGPNLPPILIRAANFHFAMDEPAAAMRYGRRILELIPDYDAVVFALYARMRIPVSQVLADGLPPARRAGVSYFRSLPEGAADGDLDTAWAWIGRRGWTDDALASEYVARLLARRDYARAVRTWAGHLGQRRGAYPEGNRLYNGGFEQEFTPAALDWKVRAADGATAMRESGIARAGAACLRVEFLGRTNVAYEHAGQTVVVEPGAYRFRAFIKTSGISTDQGVRFRIADPAAPARLEAITDGHTGSRDWIEVSRVIQVPPATRLVTVQVVRQASMKFDNKIRGTAWVDDVELAPLR